MLEREFALAKPSDPGKPLFEVAELCRYLASLGVYVEESVVREDGFAALLDGRMLDVQCPRSLSAVVLGRRRCWLLPKSGVSLRFLLVLLC